MVREFIDSHPVEFHVTMLDCIDNATKLRGGKPIMFNEKINEKYWATSADGENTLFMQ